MSAICNCMNPKPEVRMWNGEPIKDKVCSNCGKWWIPEHGSRQPWPELSEVKPGNPKPNNFCPCGSGRKYKKCCMPPHHCGQDAKEGK